MMDLSKLTLADLQKLVEAKLQDEADKYFFNLIKFPNLILRIIFEIRVSTGWLFFKISPINFKKFVIIVFLQIIEL